MTKLVVRSFAISLDGFSAAPGQSQEAPFGKDGLRLMNWAFKTKAALSMEGGTSFTFVTEGIEAALKLAFAAAKGKDSLADTGRDLADKSRDLYDKGRRLADEAAHREPQDIYLLVT